MSGPSSLNRFVKRGLGRAASALLPARLASRLARLYTLKVQPAARRFRPLFGVTVMAGVTYKCQCRCSHCGTMTYATPGREELGEEETLSLIRQAAGLGAGGFYFFGGEPLLVPWLPRLISEARRLGLVTSLDTNGVLLDRRAAAALRGAGLDRIGVSLDSADEAEHDRLRGYPGAWRAAVDALRFCAEEGMEVCASTYATKESLRDGGLDRTIALARRLGVKTRVLSSLRAGRWLERDDVPFAAGDIALLRERLAPDVYWESLELTSPEAEFTCGCASRTHFYVSPYGEVQPCCYVPLSFGNIRSEGLAAIVGRMWGSAMFTALDSSTDCPMNSEKFRETFGGVLSRPGPGPHPAEQTSSPNDPAEWDEWAPHYGEDVDWVEEIHNPDVRELSAPAGRRVLDLGCGTGRRARAAFAGAARLAAVDSSPGMAAVARGVLGDMPNAEVLELDIERDELPPGPFDAAVAVSTMHHIRDAEAALEKVKARLAPGGVILIVDALRGNPPLTALGYYLEMLRLHSPLRLLRGFARAFFLDTRVARHKAREVHLTFEEFRRRYGRALPGARAEVRHGIFGYLVWRKPS